MSERQRALPAWMEKKEKEKEKEKELLKKSRKRKTARSAFYCLNERELLEAAVSCLTRKDEALLRTHQQVEDKAAVKAREEPATSKTTAKLVTLEEESSDCGDALESTYVSETDLDITEVETVPYTKSPQHQVPRGQRSGPEQDHCGIVNAGLEDEEKEEHSQMPAEAAEEDDDALRLVREIFFT